MSTELKTRAEKAFNDAMKVALKLRSHTTFGFQEQMTVIQQMNEFMLSDSEAQAEGFDAIRVQIGRVVNASALAQDLEKEGIITRAKKNSEGAKAGKAFLNSLK